MIIRLFKKRYYDSGILPNKEITKYKIISLVLLNGPISGTLRFLTARLLGSATYGTYAFMGFVLAQVLIYIYNNPRDNTSKKIAGCFTLYFLGMAAMYMLFPVTRQYYTEYLHEIINVFLISMPAMAIMSEILDVDALLFYLLPYLRISAIVFPIVYLIGGSNFFGFMTWGSRVLPIPLLYAVCFNNNKCSRYDKILYIISIVFTLFGGRQSLVFMIVSLVFVKIFGGSSKRKQIYTFFLLAIIVLILYAFYDQFLGFLRIALETFNIKSRSLTYLANEELFDTSNRTNIYTYSIEIIKNNGVNVSGLFADRMFLRQYRRNIAYAHNIVLEMLIDFGLILGTFLVLLFLFRTLKQYKLLNDKDKIFAVILFVLCVARLFVSSSFIISTTFPIFIGFIENRGLRNAKYM